MLLLIVVPAAIGIVIIIAIIVAVLVCICCMKSANHRKRWEKSYSVSKLTAFELGIDIVGTGIIVFTIQSDTTVNEPFKPSH